MQVYLIIAIFLLTLIIIGGKQGLASVIGLAFTVICILFLFLPMIYKGHSQMCIRDSFNGERGTGAVV